MDERARNWLVCRVQDSLCALPLSNVVETLRPLKIEVVEGAPEAVLGFSVIRGVPVLVVDAGRLLTGLPGSAARFVILAIGERRIALAVSAVLDVRAAAPQSVQALPPLLQGACRECVDEVGRLDDELLLVLNAARLLPDPSWAAKSPAAVGMTLQAPP